MGTQRKNHRACRANGAYTLMIMSLKVYRFSNYLNTAEREQFRSLCKLLKNSSEDYILVANPIINGRELDALLIKRHAIIILEFKNYSGVLSASEYGDWHIKNGEDQDVVVKGGYGNKNPFIQLSHNRWSVINKFKDDLDSEFPEYSELVNAYHISGLIVFNGEITEGKYDFPSKIKTWLRISDMDHVRETIEDVTSDQINFNDALWRELPTFLKVQDYEWTEYEQPSSESQTTTNREANTPNQEEQTHKEPTLSAYNEKDIRGVITANGFRICEERREAKRDAILKPYDDLNLSEASLKFLKNKGINSLWAHQHLAIQKAKEGKNLCITTSTSSGKTEIFQISAMEELSKKLESKILAIYPMKALNRQQLERWEKTGFTVGKIDGDVPFNDRTDILEKSQIVVATPDVLHAYFLGCLNDNRIGKTIQDFIKNVSLIIIDELHLFKGVFGTNSAYLFRRFNNIRRLLRKDNSFAQYITASATLPNATGHSFNITGVKDFEEIGTKQDASPTAEKIFYFIEKDDNHADVNELVSSLSTIEDSKSITFVEGRQKTGEMAYRAGDNITRKESPEDSTSEDDNDSKAFKELEQSGIYPYRAGYEIESVNLITEKLNSGDFKGVISTSALEIGIDIEGLNIAIIADMPHDKNSYMQRIGRVGRSGCKKSYVIVVKNNYSLTSRLLFDRYNYNIDEVLPDYEPALYLEDKTVQSIHALCHVGDTDYCEYAMWKKQINQKQEFRYDDCFPISFAELCQDVLTGQTSKIYTQIANVIGSPQMAYPLRFFSDSYKIVPIRGERNYIPEESITREQLVTEGYVGAVRNTMSRGQQIRERVMFVDFSGNDRTIQVRREYNKYISTTPQKSKYIIPNFNQDARKKTIYWGETKVFNLEVREFNTIYGYWEKHNRQKEYKQYTKNGKPSPHVIRPEKPTTGTVFFHPSFNKQSVQTRDIAKALFEVFLRFRAFDRNDINYIGGKLFNSNQTLKRDDRFIALYDANDLNISSKSLDEKLLKELFQYISDNMELIIGSVCPTINEVTIESLKELCSSVLNNEADLAYKDLGKGKEYKGGTIVIYKPIDEENTETDNGQMCIFAGKGIEGTYNILLNGGVLTNIPAECIFPSESTEYE